jgi:hypothetical protein
MNKRSRLIFLAIALIILLLVGRFITGSFEFITTQFWFTSGLFLLVLLSLIDQPNFSKDANIFVNATTAWMSLILILPQDRTWVWWTFFGFTTYLITSSYILIWVRKKELKHEHWLTAFVSRINRQIGRPESIFSTFFLWGAIRQFGISSAEFDTLLIYWVIFMILNLPAFAAIIDKIFTTALVKSNERDGRILKLIDPKVAEVQLPTDFPENLIGKEVEVLWSEEQIGAGVFIDERTIAGCRIAKVVITSTKDKWRMVSDTSNGDCIIRLQDPSTTDPNESNIPICVVDKGTTIENLVFYLHPNINLEEGEILYVSNVKEEKVFYQVVAAQITEELSNEGNLIQSIKVTASQLGLWNDESKTFSPYSWVPPSGQLVFQGKNLVVSRDELPANRAVVGVVPNSQFPIHVSLEDIVTHNTAIIGVTGSGKSYLSFSLIEALISQNIRVMVLDLTREHYEYLHKHDPYQLKTKEDVTKWLTTEDASKLAMHQYAGSVSFPATTHEFIRAAFDVLSAVKLEAGKNIPAKLCIVLEEAHSLIPEWNQVAVQSDKDHVNNTARIILQGRKFGMGSILITQRTANVTKTILNQCNTIFALQSFDQTGLEFLRNYMGEEYSHALSRLPQRQGVLVGKASSSQKPIIFKIDDYDGRWQSPDEPREEAH